MARNQATEKFYSVGRGVNDERSNQLFQTITLGTVVATNDPQQQGRVRAICPAFNDDPDEEELERIPWAMYITPFGGSVRNIDFDRGPTEDATTDGAVAYGMWNVPKIGATVLVACLNGDPAHRVWMGCLLPQALSNTLPHGRYHYNADQISSLEGVATKVEGPLSTNDDARIQPLYDNQTVAFQDFNRVALTARDSFEFRTRCADYITGAITTATNGPNNLLFNNADQFVADQFDLTFTAEDGSTTHIRQGYEVSRIDPDTEWDLPENANLNLDSQIYSWTTPGFHSMSMDDRVQNARMRFRTSAGHQIILDDTNERIYINTSQGKNWIEIDQDGNIDIFTEKKVSVHSKDNINLTSDNQIRMYADKGIHMHSGSEIRMNAASDISVHSSANLRTHADSNVHLQSGSSMHLKAGGSLFGSAGSSINFNAASNANMTSGGTMNLKAGSQILQTGTQIHFNGPAATSASQASNAGEQLAFFTNRVPEHEPWGRTTTAGDFTHDPKFEYNDPNVGREDTTRGPHWRR